MTEQLPKGYSPRLYNQDLGPLPQKWTWYNIFAFWMSDVHSVGGYVFAASLFALGLASWQVLIARARSTNTSPMTWRRISTPGFFCSVIAIPSCVGGARLAAR